MVDVSRRQPWSVWSGVGGATVLAVLAAGGLNPSAVVATDVKPLVAGTSVDTGPFDITVERLRVVDELPGVSENDDSTRVIAMVATVAITQSTTQGGYLLNESVMVSGVPGLVSSADATSDDPTSADLTRATDTYVMQDGTRLDALQPGLEYEVAIVWEQDSTEPVPTEAEITLIGYTFRESSIDRTQEWLDPVPIRAAALEITIPSSEPSEQDGG